MFTEYDKCKAACKQTRDTQNTQQANLDRPPDKCFSLQLQYVEQLREELRLAEERLLQEQQLQQAAIVHPHDTQQQPIHHGGHAHTADSHHELHQQPPHHF